MNVSHDTIPLTAHGHGIHQTNGNSTGNYQLIEEEFIGRMVILRRITISWMRNLAEECFSVVNYKLKNAKSP
jgi:hypothetical protein